MKIIRSLGLRLRLTIVIVAIVLAMRSASLFAAVSGLDGNRPGTSRAAGSPEIPAVVARQPMAPNSVATGSTSAVANLPPSSQARPAFTQTNAEAGTSSLRRGAPESAAETTASAAPKPAASPMPTGPSPLPSEDAPLVETVTLRRSQLEERERRLAEREAVAAATEKRLSARVVELGELQNRLQTLQTALQERNEANWTGLVKLYEGMRPRDAAAIFNALDKTVLLEVLDRMRPEKASLVLASMEPEKARQITTDLAAKRTQSTTIAN